MSRARAGADDERECEAGHALGGGRAQRLHRVRHAQQRERGAVEVQRGDGDKAEQAADQKYAAETREHHIRGMLAGGGEVEARGRGGGNGADQHHPGPADEGTEVGPPERGAHAHIARQVARIVRDVERPAQLVGGRREQLREEGHGANSAGSHCAAGNLMP